MSSESKCSSCGDTSCSAKNKQKNESPEQYAQRQVMEQRLCQISNKILVMSGKGGVGKSSTAVNLALALAQQGKAVGLLDIDIHGPSVPKMLGIEGQKPLLNSDGSAMIPVNYEGLKVMSLGFLLESTQNALIWRGPMKAGVIQQFLRDVEWGCLDYLVVDCPPGTGDEALAIAQSLNSQAQALIVTTPQDVALIDVEKSITFCRQLKLPILGIIENMSGFVCPHCSEVVDVFKRGGGERLARDMDITFLGRIPLDPALAAAGDEGKPVVLSQPEGPTTEALRCAAQTAIRCCSGES